MSNDDFEHLPVLLDEVLAALEPKPGAKIFDCTFGRGGHTRALLAELDPSAEVFAIDKDPEAVLAASAMAATDPRVTVMHASFSDLKAVAESHGVLGDVTGVLFDLGVSSPQLDDPQRGFSFLDPGPLDMRMDPSSGRSAAEWLSRVTERDLCDALKSLGEERYARRIARSIVAARKRQVIETTTQLAEIVTRASPTRERGKHPATRTFRAIRMYVNRELEELQRGLVQAVEVLAPEGRLAVISFHSLEDRVAKRFIRAESRDSEPFPPARNGFTAARLRAVGKPIFPSADEIARNPRARSAVLRVAERKR